MLKNLIKVYISVTNDIITDQRVDKAARSLLKLGIDILVIGRLTRKTFQIPVRPYKQKRFRLLFNKGPLFYAEYNIRLFFFLLFRKYDLLLANDLDTLPANYLAGKIRRKKLVYDSHEYFTEVPELAGRNFTRRVWTAIEKCILPRIKYSYTVCESIAKIYSEKYNIGMQVIRNLPEYIKVLPKIKVSIRQQGEKVIVYQGSLNMARGLELAIEAMNHIDKAKLVIIGDGDITGKLKRMADKPALRNKVQFIPRMPYDELVSYTIQADLGISLEEKIGLNYYYALPNKLFDYIQARIPVLVSDFPEMARIVKNYGIGRAVSISDPLQLASVIREMIEDKNQIKIWKQNLEEAARKLCWEKEEDKLLSIYSDIIYRGKKGKDYDEEAK
jgi:glycosyltransferase involved in cell wall biosynthesis